MADLFGITFARPAALWICVALPLIAVLGWALGVYRRGMPRLALLLRLVVISLLAVSLAQPLLASGGNAVSTVFVVDRSKSLTDPTGARLNTWINAALQGAGSGERAAIISFGSSPVLAAAAGPARSLGRGWEDIPNGLNRDNTNLESALALARSLPLGGSRRIVLASDGAENVGSALNQAAQAASDGTPIDVLPVDGVGASDLRVEGAVAPSSTWMGEPVTVLVSIATGTGGDGSVELLVDGVSRKSIAATFPIGLSSYSFDVKDLKPGFHALTVQVHGPDAIDRYKENNVLPLALVVRDAPKLLLVAPTGSDPGRLQTALEQLGAKVTRIEPSQVSSRLSELGVYDAFILNNVSASALSLDQLTGLQLVTKTLGRGLMVLGGTASYGPGGYAGTILEDTLPVTVKVTDGKQRQRIALLLIIDKSGSMSYDPLGGTSKIDMAKQAAQVAVGALADGDQIGILTFNDQQQWVVPMKTLQGQASRDQINAAIQGITADGGTEIFPALSLGFDTLRHVDADVRHIVLLTDGKSRTGTRESYQKLIADSISDRTTLSTIAIGNDSDTDLLQFLAEHGNGRYHYTEKPADIPKLILQEARSAGSQSVIRGTFHPIQSQASPIMAGFGPEELPNLDGYDFAQVKPNAQTVLTSQRDDPILAKWQYGLGRVVAWTADDGADFALAWPGWPRYDEFWANMTRWVLPDPENRPLQVSVKHDGPEAVVTVNSVGQQGDYVDLAQTTATITSPSGGVRKDLKLYQSGPGEYQLRVAAPESGAYKVELHQQRADQTLDELAGFAVPPSPELQPVPGASGLLKAIAARTSGRVLSLDDASAVFSSAGLHGTPLRDYRPVWYIPLALALLALLAELGVRLQFFSRLRVLRRGTGRTA